MASLTLDSRKSPGSNDPLQTILVSFLGVSRGMAPSAVILLILLAGMVIGPFPRLHVILVLARNIALGTRHGDDVSLFVHVADLPVSPSDHIGDIIPRVTGRERYASGLGILGLPQFVRMPRGNELIIDCLMTFEALCRTHVIAVGLGLGETAIHGEQGES